MTNSSKFLFLIFSIFIFSPILANAQEPLKQELVFNVEPSFDSQGKNEITAVLTNTSRTAYWYLDSRVTQTQETDNALNALSQEFEENIYPTMTKAFGSEWTPGIDKDTRITILFHLMKEKKGGYFRSADEYPRIQIPNSNEKEMIYLNSQNLIAGNIKSLLAH